jgi:hypothetical protein
MDNITMKAILSIDATKYGLPEIISVDNINNSKNHWLLRVGNGNNFKNSSKFSIWGVKETTNTKNFKKLVKKGDILWFIVSRNKAPVIAFAEYISHNERTKTDTELGWEPETNSSNWTTEINYKNLTNIENENYFTQIIGQNVNIRKYNDKCKINLPQLFQKLSTRSATRMKDVV